MKMPCDKAIRCDPGIQALGYDFPVANFSSEAPDKPIFLGVNFGWDYNVPPLGTIYSTPGCVSWCNSDVSQDEADLCAALQQVSCLVDTGGDPSIPPGGDGSSNPNLPPSITPPGQTPPTPSQPALNGNSAQTCSYTCPDGKVFTETVAAGAVMARSEVLADQIANSLACQRLAKKVICTGTFDGFACADPFHEHPEYSFLFTATSPNPPLVWTVNSGSLPPGLTLEPGGLLHGVPDQAGDYNFTIRVTNSTGAFADRPSSFHVLGLSLTSPVLDDTKVDNAYSFQLPGAGGAIDFFLVDGSLPHGLTLDISGMIHGTPDQLGGSLFTVAVQDAFLNRCTYDLVLAVTGPKITCPGTGTVCHAYNDTATASPAGCTFSGTFPKGLSINPATGQITGVPLAAGSFVITANDGTHTNTITCPNLITVAVGELASSAKDLVWTESHIYDPGCSGSVSGTGDHLSITTHGFCAGGSSKQSTERADSTLRNCSANPYTLTVSIDYVLPWAGCGVSDSIIDIFVTANGGADVLINAPLIYDTSGLHLQVNGTVSGTVSIPAFSPGVSLHIDCRCRGDVDATFKVTLTPATPP